MYDGIERRKYPRADASFLVSYKEIDNQDFNLSQTKNISQGGMLLTTSEIFPDNASLDMIISFPFFSQRINVSGRVVRQKEVTRNFFYETGVEFNNLDQSVFEKIGEFLIKT